MASVIGITFPITSPSPANTTFSTEASSLQSLSYMLFAAEYPIAPTAPTACIGNGPNLETASAPSRNV